ncbi:E3 ubiquitin-protein ligase MARCHF5-like [Daphnia pulicaria]|uniref:E3 ubiquitin-protein ligase MARCHF5-like n=1 Tax=Daphnia pulicaria TaxID=35523 RepID=UPI001EEB7F6B|nr:E3 ubiquitin-protein ligase MARCHF5-like [Daphnia pulicaria]
MEETEEPVIETNRREDLHDDNKRYCWVCFATDEDDLTAVWVQPCQCSGTTRWVHESCLQRWVDEKQKGNSLERVHCPQCNTQYVIVFPPIGKLILVLDIADRIIYRVCPFIAAGVVIGSIYWTAVTYGALTIMQAVGAKEGLALMEQSDPLFLLIGLPTVPIMLILGRLVRWEEALLGFLNKNVPRMPIVKHLLPTFQIASDSVRPHTQGTEPPFSDPVSATRVLCGALIFPSMAVLFGKLLFHPVHSNLKKTFFGGIAFLMLKGALKIYYKQQILIRQYQRRVLDFAKRPSDGKEIKTSSNTNP